MAQGTFHPPRPVTIYGIGEIENAFRLVQTGKHRGKIVIEMRKEDRVTTLLKTKPSFTCDGKQTYVIAGGLGGLGSNIANWLVDHGARHLLLLSRSGGDSKVGRAFVKSLQSRDVDVYAPPCDVSDDKAVRDAIRVCQSRMPPIRSCIQGAMVLEDCLFEEITYDAWQTAVKPKVQGSWNLHQTLTRGMDFFIMLSSISGVVGFKGQANYGAGNTFQDPLAYHRMAVGERGTALNLGVFGFAGVVARSAKLFEIMLSNSVYRPILEAELHALLDYYYYKRGAGTSEWLEKPLFQCLGLDESRDDAREGHNHSTQVGASLASDKSLDEAIDVVSAGLKARLCRMLSLNDTDINPNIPLHRLGVDSLVAVELRTWFAKELQADIAMFDVMGNSTITTLARLVASRTTMERGYAT